MKRIRIKVTILASWLVLILVIDRLLAPIAISSASIALILVMAVTSLLMPRKPAILLWFLAALPLVALFLIKAWTGTLLGDLGFSLAIIEALIIAFTIVLASWVSAGLNKFEVFAANMAFSESDENQKNATSGLGVIYREVRRARNHQRPLALISVGVEEGSINLDVDKMVEEFQLSMMKQFKLQHLSKMLCEQLEDCAIVVRETDRFLAVLPETKPEEVPFVIERLRQSAHNQVNVELKIGAATLPNDSYTFEGLLDKATKAMDTTEAPQPYVVLDKQPVERQIH